MIASSQTTYRAFERGYPASRLGQFCGQAVSVFRRKHLGFLIGIDGRALESLEARVCRPWAKRWQNE